MPFDRSLYPANWEQISLAVKQAAGWRCENCGAEHDQPHPVTGSRVILTTAHLDHDPANCARENLRAWCQRCHLRYDQRLHIWHAAETRRRRLSECGQLAFEFLACLPSSCFREKAGDLESLERLASQSSRARRAAGERNLMFVITSCS